ncbi:M16 family metallopeptidase [Methylotuvimicrobium alcaliphilum]|uniref:Peptidase M16 n=1 Tax=Methylotuvimicrobium alcaliphilum (strain DSM 19304 / NCIMB 14124 / VKM B-2133 / 20Z) TaxID=1091494 RepID=G4T363_META2|nr:pitrilysin family protein [Methylotuvimicrobium alcaliphilum]CCE24805.1 Putative peptidase M16 [Methylotuvimicrobium alcaliphilum 20Z]
MRIALISLLLILTGQSAWAAENIEHWTTKQGARVYFVPAPNLPMADIRVTFDAGSARDGKQFGIAALTSGLLDTGAGEWNADQIAQRFESVGARFGTGVSRDMAWLSLRTLTEPKLFDKAVETMQTILTQPRFEEADFQREKQRTLAGLKHRESSPSTLADIAFYKAVYGQHPYAHPSAGEIETVEPLQAEDLKNFYRQYYVAANAMVAIVGDLTRKQAEQVAERLLGKLPVGQKPAELPEVPMPKQGRREHIAFPSAQTHVMSGLPGTYRNDDDYFALYVGNHILGGGMLVSRLFEEVREKRGLAYNTYSYFAPMYRKGPFAMGLQTRTDQADKALAVLNQTLNEFIKDGPTEEELTAAKQNITGGFVMRFDTNSKMIGYVEMIGFYGLPLDYLETFQEKVNAVTVEHIKDAFNRRVDAELLQTITVGETQ